MGTNTEFYMAIKLKETPQIVKDVLLYLSRQGDEPKELPDHPLFKTNRWSSIGRSASEYTFPSSFIQYKKTTLCFLCSLKNYDEEIDKFLDWINPYISSYDGNHIGHYRHEENQLPTLITYK